MRLANLLVKNGLILLGIENQLNAALFQGYGDKSFLDKVFAKEDVTEIKDILKKDELERTDYARLNYLLASTEIKLLNFEESDRYLLGKYLAWIGDFTSAAGILFDYQDEVKTKLLDCSGESEKILDDCRKIYSHNCKTLVSSYLYIARSSLSKGAKAFDTATTTRYEYDYKNPELLLQQAQQRQGGLRGLIK